MQNAKFHFDSYLVQSIIRRKWKMQKRFFEKRKTDEKPTTFSTQQLVFMASKIHSYDFI